MGKRPWRSGLLLIQSAGSDLETSSKFKVDLGENLAFYVESTRAFMDGLGFKLIATEDQNQGRHQNLTFISSLA
jgi:hypothetical protein